MNPLIDEINSLNSDRARVVAFDIGGVLVKINRQWEDALREAGIRVKPIGGLEVFPGVETLQLGAMTSEEYFADLQVFLGLKDESQAEEVHKLILVEPYPGTLELIEELNQQGIITACLSNTNEPHWIEMTAGRFPNVAALHVTAVSHELKLQKPEESIYEAFESLVEARPREIVFFDDIEENVEAALERGWRAYWIDHEKDTAEQMELILIAEGVLQGP
jgi:putative hydrolase of the HAD superfamily